MKRKIFTMILGFLLPIDLFAGTGDVNVDGVLDSADIQALINYLMNGQTKGFNMAEADANNDGFVNVSDVTKIIHSMTDKNEVVVLNMAALKQKGNANTTGLSAFDAQKISKLHLKITMPQAGDFKAVILETDGRLVTKKTYNKVINKICRQRLQSAQVCHFYLSIQSTERLSTAKRCGRKARHVALSVLTAVCLMRLQRSKDAETTPGLSPKSPIPSNSQRSRNLLASPKTRAGRSLPTIMTTAFCVLLL